MSADRGPSDGELAAARGASGGNGGVGLGEERLERLLELGRSLVGDLDLGLVLRRVLEAGRELTGARYAALGILDSRREELEQFLTVGIDDQTRRELAICRAGAACSAC